MRRPAARRNSDPGPRKAPFRSARTPRSRSGALVTKVDNQLINNADALAAAVHTKAPGATIAVNYLDPSGVARTAQVLLGTDQGQQS